MARPQAAEAALGRAHPAHIFVAGVRAVVDLAAVQLGHGEPGAAGGQIAVAVAVAFPAAAGHDEIVVQPGWGIGGRGAGGRGGRGGRCLFRGRRGGRGGGRRTPPVQADRLMADRGRGTGLGAVDRGGPVIGRRGGRRLLDGLIRRRAGGVMLATHKFLSGSREGLDGDSGIPFHKSKNRAAAARRAWPATRPDRRRGGALLDPHYRVLPLFYHNLICGISRADAPPAGRRICAIPPLSGPLRSGAMHRACRLTALLAAAGGGRAPRAFQVGGRARCIAPLRGRSGRGWRARCIAPLPPPDRFHGH